jgi:hypothetical protein
MYLIEVLATIAFEKGAIGSFGKVSFLNPKNLRKARDKVESFSLKN